MDEGNLKAYHLIMMVLMATVTLTTIIIQEKIPWLTFILLSITMGLHHLMRYRELEKRY